MYWHRVMIVTMNACEGNRLISFLCITYWLIAFDFYWRFTADKFYFHKNFKNKRKTKLRKKIFNKIFIQFKSNDNDDSCSNSYVYQKFLLSLHWTFLDPFVVCSEKKSVHTSVGLCLQPTVVLFTSSISLFNESLNCCQKKRHSPSLSSFFLHHHHHEINQERSVRMKKRFFYVDKRWLEKEMEKVV